jgi:malonate transporter and related proteins
MGILIDVVLPVFFIIGFGYAAARAKLLSESAIDGLMRFSQSFAIPCLLFRSIADLDLSTSFDPGLLLSFYIGAFTGFAAGFFGAHKGFHRPLDESVAIGFACMFSNSLLLGLSITERAYGKDALAGNYAIIAMHSPMFYAFGIALMEWVRSRGQGLSGAALGLQVTRAIFSQPLVIGIVLGVLVNLTGVPVPVSLGAAVDMMGRAGLPAALFGLGGILLRYKPEGDRALIALVVAITLLLHPIVTYVLARYVFVIDVPSLRSAVVTAAMPPGVNAYLFAYLYGTGRRVAASSVLIATALSILTAWFWLQLLP